MSQDLKESKQFPLKMSLEIVNHIVPHTTKKNNSYQSVVITIRNVIRLSHLLSFFFLLADHVF